MMLVKKGDRLAAVPAYGNKPSTVIDVDYDRVLVQLDGTHHWWQTLWIPLEHVTIIDTSHRYSH